MLRQLEIFGNLVILHFSPILSSASNVDIYSSRRSVQSTMGQISNGIKTNEEKISHAFSLARRLPIVAQMTDRDRFIQDYIPVSGDDNSATHIDACVQPLPQSEAGRHSGD